MLMNFDKASGPPDNPLKEGAEAPKFSLMLSSKTEINISHLLEKGPVLLNFIRGTWCIYCRTHLGNLEKWQKNVKKNVSILVVSNESVEDVATWKEKSNISYLMGSDPEEKIINQFGLHLTEAEETKPATFLIDKNGIIRMAYYEKRTRKYFKQVDNSIEQIEAELLKKYG